VVTNLCDIQFEVGLRPSIYRDTHSKVLGGMQLVFTTQVPCLLFATKRQHLDKLGWCACCVFQCGVRPF